MEKRAISRPCLDCTGVAWVHLAYVLLLVVVAVAVVVLIPLRVGCVLATRPAAAVVEVEVVWHAHGAAVAALRQPQGFIGGALMGDALIGGALIGVY